MSLECRDAWFFPSTVALKCGEEAGKEDPQEFRGVPPCFLLSLLYESLTPWGGGLAEWGEAAPPS